MTLTDLTATEVSSLLERREVSAPEVMTAALDRIEAVNGPVNAVVSLRDREDLMAAARAADAAPRKGWLHGIPIAVKDLANAAGLPTSMGSPIFRDFRPRTDDLAIGRMRDAGAIFIGKTNVPEFGLGSHSVNPVHGPCRNPWDVSRSAGGSSGGAGVALSLGMQWVCDGSDMMGSLRNPAAWNNVYGFRPSWGLVPGEPVGDVFLHPLSTLGPMARNPRDLTRLLDTMAGPDPRQPFSLPRAEPLAPDIEAEVKGRRIAWAADWGGAYAMEDGVLDTCEAALAAFDAMGCTVEKIDPPFPAEEIWDSWTTLRSFAVAAKQGVLYNNPEHRALLNFNTTWETERGLKLTAMEVQAASLKRSRWWAAAVALFKDYDALVLPVAQCWPFPVDWAWPREVGGREMDTYHRWMEVVIPASLLGLPALSVPAGFGAAGLPMGLQIIGPRGGDLGVLQLGQAWHEATDWHARRPPVG